MGTAPMGEAGLVARPKPYPLARGIVRRSGVGSGSASLARAGLWRSEVDRTDGERPGRGAPLSARRWGVRLGGLAALMVLWVRVCAEPLPVAQVFRWVDAAGVTHFSESPPPKGGSRAVERVPLADFPQARQAPDYRAWLEVANELKKDRLERERARAEAQRLQRLRSERLPDTGLGRDYDGPYGYLQPRIYPRPCPRGWVHCRDLQGPRPRRLGQAESSRPGGWGPRPPPTGDPTINRYLRDPSYRYPRLDHPPRRMRPYPGFETPPAIRSR